MFGQPKVKITSSKFEMRMYLKQGWELQGIDQGHSVLHRGTTYGRRGHRYILVKPAKGKK